MRQRQEQIQLIAAAFNNSSHYRVSDSEDTLVIRESTQDPPNQQRQAQSELIFLSLQAAGINAHRDTINITGLDGQPHPVTRWAISKAMEAKQGMDAKGRDAKAAQPMPPSMAELEQLYRGQDDEQEARKRAQLIRSQWALLSRPVQKHVQECIAFDLLGKLAEQKNPVTTAPLGLGTVVLGAAMRSPLTEHTARIPVKIPRDTTDSVYDLADLLLLAPKGAANRREDPNNNQPFTLDEITIPAGALKQLEEEIKLASTPLEFPSGADFKNRQFPAIFEFKTLAAAQVALQKMDTREQVVAVQENGKFLLKFSIGACRADLVKTFLNLFSYDNDQANRAASYLAHRAKNTNQYYDRGCLGFLYKAFSESRENRCSNAFNRITGNKVARGAQQASMLVDNVVHYRNI